MNVSSIVILVVTIAFAILAVWRAHKKGAPCECCGNCKCCGGAKLMAMAAIAALATSVFADADTEPEVLVEAKDEIPVSAEFGLAFDSKYMTYGVVDGKDPIVTPSAEISFFDTLYFGVESIFDITRGNGGRAGRYSTLDAIVGLRHDFDLGETLGALSVDVNYIYEFIPRRNWNDETCKYDVDDTQYVNLELSLGDLWLEPTLAVERDLMADDGTYVNFEIGHTFALTDDFSLRPAVGQGFGNTQRVRGYFNKRPGSDEPLDHGGLMDTSLSLTAEWTLCDNLTLSGYVAYYDYLFDGTMRDGARQHNADARGRESEGADSANFVGGLALTASF